MVKKMAQHRWRDSPEVIATMIDSGSIFDFIYSQASTDAFNFELFIMGIILK